MLSQPVIFNSPAGLGSFGVRVFTKKGSILRISPKKDRIVVSSYRRIVVSSYRRRTVLLRPHSRHPGPSVTGFHFFEVF